MDDRIFKGRLARWNDDRGFGFVRSEGDSKDVFLHISAFRRNIGRRPQLGDIIYYQTHTENNGKVRAVNAAIEGLAPKSPNYTLARLSDHAGRSEARRRVNRSPAAAVGHPITRTRIGKPKVRRNGGWMSNALYMLLLGSLAIFGYNKLAYDGGPVTDSSEIPSRGVQDVTEIVSQGLPMRERYSCQGKVYCSQMTSCEEARYYLVNCPGTKMDGDRDGVPCESQWCGR